MAESARKIVSGGLHIDQRLYALVAEQIAPGTDVDVDHFWASLEKIVQDLSQRINSYFSAATPCKPRSTPITNSGAASR